MLGRITSALNRPGQNMTWTQLAGATVFVLVVILAWRQVTFMIMREV
jgi:hypothetical protein